MKDGQESIAKASYLFDSINYGIVLKDSQIDDLESDDIDNWDLEDEKFKTSQKWLVDKDVKKEKPKKAEEDNQSTLDPSGIDISDTGGSEVVPDLWEMITGRTDY